MKCPQASAKLHHSCLIRQTAAGQRIGVKEAATKDEAAKIKKVLEEQGATVEIK